jgi:nitrate/nitrite-specific signal transduction histidine kinase
MMGINADISDAIPGEHVGLTIMRERAQRIGAELTIESDPGEGTRIELELRQAKPSSPLENSRRWSK